jgi:DNA (cytosine-5)-methyltransferase 1
MITVGSLFTGIGGFDLGLENIGMKVSWQCEIDNRAREVLDHHWPELVIHTDIKELYNVSPVNLLCGGFPCQDVSVAGQRAGLAGDRSGLFHEYMRIIDEIHPRWVLIENVPGLLSSQSGRDMGTVLGNLADLGYGFAYRVLDAQYFGVAQRRRRVFIVGCLGDATGAAEVLFEPTSLCGDSAPSRKETKQVAAPTARGVGASGQSGHLIPAVSPCLEAHAQRNEPSKEAFVMSFHQTQDPISAYELTPALGATSEGMGVGMGMLVRRLTPIECERLQGFPDDWTSSISDSQRYRTLGNAVCVPVVEWIGQRIMTINNQEEIS